MNVLLPIMGGLAQGMILFLAASGLTLVFGVMGILNFAHGGFFALGAFVIYSLTGGANLPAWQFLALCVVGAAAVGAVGMVFEVIVFRRIYHLPHLDALLATYAVLLTVTGAMTQVWGVASLGQPMPSEFRTALRFGGAIVPVYDLVLIVIGVLVAVGLWFLLERTAFGRSVRAISADRQMSASLGINVGVVYTVMLGLGLGLAGLGGALVSPLVQTDTGLAALFVIQSFAVVIVGGLGSISGALVAALALGLLNSMLVTVNPALAGFSLYIGMTAVLLVRPQGLFGRPLDRA